MIEKSQYICAWIFHSLSKYIVCNFKSLTLCVHILILEDISHYVSYAAYDDTCIIFLL